MPTYRDQAVVLRAHKLGEADRIVTLLTGAHGKVRAVVKGVRRTSSKWGARLEPFSYVDVLLAEGRSLDTVTQAQTLRPYSKAVGADYARFTAGEVMLETADRLVTEEGQPARKQFLLLVGALQALTAGTADGPRPPTAIMDSYLLRAAALAGFAPVLGECAGCGAPGPHPYFSVQLGGTACERCRPVGAVGLSAETLAYLRALACGDWPATRDVAAAAASQASGIVAAFVSWYLEQGIRSLEHVDRDGLEE
ncbi:MAG: DNA repair protein RecO [Propionibacteriaceae bacterium]|nr:DNA repair protein RecO [Propionibacteriaceae bacterium]